MWFSQRGHEWRHNMAHARCSWIGKATCTYAHAHAHATEYPHASPQQQWFVNAPQCYVIRALPVLFFVRNTQPKTYLIISVLTLYYIYYSLIIPIINVKFDASRIFTKPENCLHSVSESLVLTLCHIRTEGKGKVKLSLSTLEEYMKERRYGSTYS